jgi:phosphoglycolate phosphatase
LNRLLVFDIDGTLLHTGGAGLRAFKRAAQAVFSCPVSFTKHDFAGKLDCLIFRKLFSAYVTGAMPWDVAWRDFQERYLSALQEEALDVSDWKVYPGVQSFLERSSRQSLLSLLTGNIKKGAEIKLRAVGLWDYFPCGAFGDAGESRSELAARALRVSGEHYQRPFDEVWVIGDTVADIECGKSIGAKTLGVRTGFSQAGELESAGADRVVETLEEVSEF